MKRIAIIACFLVLALVVTSCASNPVTQNDTAANDVIEDGNGGMAEETAKSLKILSIGNSFSVDAQQWLYGIAENAGYDEIVLGNLYYGGCSLYGHDKYAKENTPAYTYYKNTTGEWTEKAETTLLTGLCDEEWDYITLQQQSGNSGIYTSYEPYLSDLIAYVNANKTNPDAKLAWHMTWAYSADSTQEAFAQYGNDQMTMYKGIVEAVEKKILTNPDISLVIPSGTAIQNARTSYMGDTFNRDGFHLELTYGRYLAGLTFFHAITGMPVDDIDYIPDEAFDEEYLDILKEAATDAVKKPQKVSKSRYTVKPFDLNDYEPVELEVQGIGCYDSTVSSDALTDAEESDSCVYSRIFTREELPDGTLLIVDKGYKYRPEGWIDLETTNRSSARPFNCMTEVVEVTEEWWGKFNYRAFNVSTLAGDETVSDAAELASHLKIYVPKNRRQGE